MIHGWMSLRRVLKRIVSSRRKKEEVSTSLSMIHG